MDTYVRQLTYSITGAAGCCGIGTISRLHGVRVTAAQRASDLSVMDADKQCLGYYSRVGQFTHIRMRAVLATLNKLPDYPDNMGGQQRRIWHGGAVPLDVAYMSVLDTMSHQTRHVAYYMSDNVEGEGDVHLGPFNTRDFHKWMVHNNLCSSVSTGPMMSLKTNRELQAWIIQPYWKYVNKYLMNHKHELYDIVKEINNNVEIKQRRQSAIAGSASELQEIQRGLSDW